MRPTAAVVLLAAVVAAALLAHRPVALAALVVVLLGVCLRAPRSRRRLYLLGVAGTAGTLFVLSPFLQSTGWHVLWSGPIVPVLGSLDVTREELRIGAVQALRLAAVGLASSCYVLMLDHDRLVRGVGWARRSALAVALATRLVPTLERDAVGLLEALRGRGVVVAGVRGHARLLSPLLAGSLERGLTLAESMEARGYGRSGATRVPPPAWRAWDRLALAAAPLLVVAGALWL